MTDFVLSLARKYAAFLTRRAGLVLLAALLISIAAFSVVKNITISTSINDLMPEGSKSVQTLNEALEKTGSFASIQVVASSDTEGEALEYLKHIKDQFVNEDWSASAQYGENVSVLAQHKLLLMSLEELQALENDINIAYPNLLAKEVSNVTKTPVSVHIRSENAMGRSDVETDTSRIESLLEASRETRPDEFNFTSEDNKSAVLIVWPKSGYDSLSSSKKLVRNSEAILASTANDFPNVKAGIAGRIASQVLQYDAIIGDLIKGLASSMTLIAILIMLFYRSALVVPIIFLPLITGIMWTLAFTTIFVGGLNLITAFLVLILFGLGIDFGIHNISRYQESRGNGKDVTGALTTVIGETGRASFMAAMTTACGFFTLMLTEFRAFTEFGLIAGAGILITLVAMFTILPAILVVIERMGWRPKVPTTKGATPKPLWSIRNKGLVKLAALALLGFALYYAPKMRFETNTKNLEATVSDEYNERSLIAKSILKTGNSRAIIVADTLGELEAIDAHFDSLVKEDVETPTIKSTQSLVDYVPSKEVQAQRLDIIRRLKKRADQFQGIDPKTYETGVPYLSIDQLSTNDLPVGLRRTLLGQAASPGYLFYVDNSVNMDDATEAAKFYNDVASSKVDGKTFYAASESFILVEMLGLMKRDATKAVILVSLATMILIVSLFRSFRSTLIVLAPTFLGIAVTVGMMGFIGPALSIMNMVILPSLIGISVDNGVHIYHRVQHEGGKDRLPYIMQTTGRAAVLTTLTTLIGFGGMITASMNGLKSMAILAIMGFLICLLMTWFLLPVLIDRFTDYKSDEVKAHG